MGIFDKLTFWKKKDDLALSNMGGLPGGMADISQMPGDDSFGADIGGMPGQPMGQYPPQQYSRQTYPQQQFQQPSFSGYPSQQQYGNRELEVVSAKLDALKAYMDSINQRLANLERLAEQQQSGRRW
ncbi:MAG: hypothetical protein V1702_00540 [Candidatus Woesearchaeota archaeon]